MKFYFHNSTDLASIFTGPYVELLFRTCASLPGSYAAKASSREQPVGLRPKRVLLPHWQSSKASANIWYRATACCGL